MGYFEQNVAYCYDDARHFEKAVRASQSRPGNHPEPIASARRLQGSILGALAVARWQTGDLDGALQTAQKAIALQEEQAAGGHASLRVNLANALVHGGHDSGKAGCGTEPGPNSGSAGGFQRGFDIGEDLAKMDPIDYLSRRTVAMHGQEIGNILRHSDPQKALAVYDRALARIREAKTNVSTQLYAADLLAGSSYAARWAGRDKDANRRIEEAFQLLRDAHQYPADTVEPMGRADHVMRASADEYAETRPDRPSHCRLPGTAGQADGMEARLAKRSAGCNVHFAHLDRACHPPPPNRADRRSCRPGGTANRTLEPLECQASQCAISASPILKPARPTRNSPRRAPPVRPPIVFL